MNQKPIDILQFRSEDTSDNVFSAEAMLPTNFNFFRSVSDFSTIENILKDKSIDVVVVDISNSIVNYISNIRALVTQFPQINLLVYSSSNHSMDVISSFRVGVKGYLLKPKELKDLVRYIEIVSLGNIVLDQSLAPSLQSKLQAPVQEHFFLELTHRENQIIWLVAQGLKNKDIAQECNISEKTVRNSLSKALKKLSFTDRREAIKKLRELQLKQVSIT